jgi:hypothetical protein
MTRRIYVVTLMHVKTFATCRITVTAPNEGAARRAVRESWDSNTWDILRMEVV